MTDKTILAWEDDPGQPDAANKPTEHPAPDIEQPPLPSVIAGKSVPPGDYLQGTPEFRHWTAADALRRVADFWGPIVGAETQWHPTVGRQLTANLDEGEEFNAFYDRKGLNFFHGKTAGSTVYSGESPDVVCHEFGHAVLDAVQPSLWAAMSAEPPALHEAFADISAMLSALQLPSLRDAVLAETGGQIDRSSRVSRLAEQLGWAIRQFAPQAVEADCLRNASNSFFYRDPTTLPPEAPSSSLCSEPHNFSRVFSGAILTGMAGMLEAQPTHDSQGLAQVTHDIGVLLIEAARTTPVCVSYYSQLAAHVLAVDQASFAGKYATALRAGFAKHGVLSLEHATSAMAPAIGVAPRAGEPAVLRTALAGDPYGLDEPLFVQAAAEPKRFAVASAAPNMSAAAPQISHEVAAAAYVEDIFQRGHVMIDPELRTGREIVRPSVRATHVLYREEGEGLVLERRLFECGLHEHSGG
jgi:hypothetical protein